MNNKFDQLVPGWQNKLHLAADSIFAILGVLLSAPLPAGTPSAAHLPLAGAVFVGWWLMAMITRLYSPCTPRRLWDNLLLRAMGVVVATLAYALAANVLLPKLDITIDYLAFVVFFYCSGAIARMLVFRPLRHFGKPVHDVLIVGTGHLANRTYQQLTAAENETSYRVVGFLTLPNQPASLVQTDVPVLGSHEDVLTILSHHPVTEVYLAGKVMEHGEALQFVVEQLERVGMPFAVPLHSLHFERAQLLSSSPARDGYLHYMSTAWKPFQYAVKRLIDILASATALALLSPLLLVVAALIKLSSPGPVLFKQTRVGLHGVTFSLLKFRSMVINAEALKAQLMAQNEQTGPVFKMKQDPRITSIGRFIRRYSIDELPQLINILRGDMTIVGPRPAVPQEVAQYKAWQRRRLSVRPGLTCYWQVGGRNAIGFDEWMRLDLRYVDNWSLAVDMQLIIQTFPAVLAGRGAS